MERKRAAAVLLLAWAALPLPGSGEAPRVTLGATLERHAVHSLREGPIRIEGGWTGSGPVWIRVTTGQGRSFDLRRFPGGGSFSAVYPGDFQGAPPLQPGTLYLDLLAETDPSGSRTEALLVVHDPEGPLPEIPTPFTTDLLDASGRTDTASREWPRVRSLVHLFMQSRAAAQIRVAQPAFELARPEHLLWFREQLSLYEWDYRDRDWSSPLGHRVARTFWQAVWDRWFNISNSHPQDGDPANRHPSNFLPYTFANDFADLLVLQYHKKRVLDPLEDNLTSLTREALANLRAMQHRGSDNFALRDAHGRERYTAGAFRYGMFEDGRFMTEGTGWFYRRESRDHAEGGVFNGRAVWALGEALRWDPGDPAREATVATLQQALKFCLQEGLQARYTRRTRAGRHRYWRDPGEHGYLLLGMLAACERHPDLPVPLQEERRTTLAELCVEGLDALVELEQGKGGFSVYPNVDAMALAALARGAAVLPEHPSAPSWVAAARRVADGWMAARVDPSERTAPIVHFGLRPSPGRMTFVWPHAPHLQVHYYITGHWIHALSELYRVTGEENYRRRAHRMIRYLCGENPFGIRILNELGAVYNWSDDLQGQDGVEDHLRLDFYPESTAFCQVGILAFLEAQHRPAKAQQPPARRARVPAGRSRAR